MVTIVLLNVAWMWACPTGTFLRSRRRVLATRLRSAIVRVCSCCVSVRAFRVSGEDRQRESVGLLLAPDADGLLGTAPLACIGLGALPADGQIAPVTETSV